MLFMLLAAQAHAADVLIYEPCNLSEEDILLAEGHTVTVWNEVEWLLATQVDFEAFDVIVIGDVGVSGPTISDYDTLEATKTVWSAAVTGNVAVSTLDPGWHAINGSIYEPFAQQYMIQAIEWAADGGSTGLYASTDFGLRNLDYLSEVAGFGSSPRSGDTVTVDDSSHPIVAGLSSSDLSGWSKSYHSTLTSLGGLDQIMSGGTSDVTLGIRFACDEDGDGYLREDAACGGTDCDDTDSAINPAATEVWYNGIDEDCDGNDGDQDLDGEDDPSVGGDDCDDLNPDINTSASETCDGVDQDCDSTIDEDASDASTWYADLDTDTYGDPDNSVTDCTQPTGYIADDTDCDDTDATVSPAGTETCNGIDDDCDGTIDENATDATTWYADDDSDTYGDATDSVDACDQPDGYVADDSDCDDTDADSNPAGTEVCDSADNDCDTVVDEGATDTTTWYADTDSDSYGDAGNSLEACDQPIGYVADDTDCDDSSAVAYPGAAEICNGLDDDCDTIIDEDATTVAIWYADTDGDGYGDLTDTVVSCTQPKGYVSDPTDCDDTDGSINPGAEEVCDGIDQDCDELIDEDAVDAVSWYVDLDQDGYGSGDIPAIVDCDQPQGRVGNDTDCDDTDAAINPGETETWYDGVDADCAGDNDYDADKDGYTHPSDPDPYGSADDCDDEDATVNTGATETWYDGIDQDCDGANDYDADGDGFTHPSDPDPDGGDDCDDADADRYPGSPISDCDEECTDCDLDGFDDELFGGTDCDDSNSAINPDADEIWYDGVDQDCDGNDDDQDYDGFPVDVDCDDTDATVFPGGGGFDEDCNSEFDYKGGGGCEGCASSSTTPSAAWMLLGLAGVLIRRRRA